MENPTLYKKVSTVDVRNGNTSQLSASETSDVNQTISKFFELFKIKHLS